MSQNWPNLSIESVSRVKGFVWLVVILVSFAALLFFGYYVKRQSRPLEYEGRIIDKWAGYSHTAEHGSIPYFKIHLETKDGQRLIVSVNDGIYHRAKVGMWYKKTRTGIELLDELTTRQSWLQQQ